MLLRHCFLGFTLPLALLACGGPTTTDDIEPARGEAAEPTAEPTTMGTIEILHENLREILPEDAEIEILAKGFEWSEGPLWVPEENFLLFSDVPQNRIYQFREGQGTQVWLEPSGYTGEVPRGGEPGSNGLTLDPEGHLVLCQHGDRRVARLDAPWDSPRPEFTTLSGHHQDRRFNSPNDLVFDQQGRLYFTDPPYGLEGGPDGPGREIPFQGVYRVDPDGTTTLLIDDLTRPNGIAVSPDQSTLYIANSDPESALWMAYDLSSQGEVTAPRVFFDATHWVSDERPGLPDGLAIDLQGRLFATGPGGVLIFKDDGTHLGSLRLPQPAANCTFGDDGSSLYITADSHLLRIRLESRGLGFGASDSRSGDAG